MTMKRISVLGLVIVVTVALAVSGTPLQADNAAGVIQVGSAIKLTANDGAANDQFGVAVARDGNRAVVGAEGQDVGGVATSNGAAYLYFQNESGNWSQVFKFTANDGEPLDGYGHAVDYDNSTLTVVVGAYTDDDSTAGVDAGSVYIYGRGESTWEQQGSKLTADDASANAQFGAAVAVEGDRALIGAPGAGAVYEFTRSNDNWTQTGKFTPTTTQAGDRFGVSVALDGDVALIGAESRVADATQSGAAYIFTRNGGNWTQQAQLLSDSPVEQGFFGASVDLAGDTAIVGAYFENATQSTTQSGTAYVFTGSGSNWTQQARLTASDAANLDSFGYDVALSANTVVIGAPLKTDDVRDKSGAVYVFERNDGVWTQETKITTTDAAARDAFGFSVALYGAEALLGAIWDDSFQGAGYVFPVEQAAPDVILVSPTGGSNDPNTDLVITFDEPVFKGSGTIEIRQGNVAIETLEIAYEGITIENNQVTINPRTLLNYGQTYTIVIPQGVFVDAENAEFAGLG